MLIVRSLNFVGHSGKADDFVHKENRPKKRGCIDGRLCLIVLGSARPRVVPMKQHLS